MYWAEDHDQQIVQLCWSSDLLIAKFARLKYCRNFLYYYARSFVLIFPDVALRRHWRSPAHYNTTYALVRTCRMYELWRSSEEGVSDESWCWATNKRTAAPMVGSSGAKSVCDRCNKLEEACKKQRLLVRDVDVKLSWPPKKEQKSSQNSPQSSNKLHTFVYILSIFSILLCFPSFSFVSLHYF